jgi:threonine-phosphate decarboxylase
VDKPKPIATTANTESRTESPPSADGVPIPIDRVHGGNHAAGLIDFSISINPLGPPPGAFEEYHAAASRITSYPPPYPAELERRIAEAAGVMPRSVIAGAGSTQLIYLAHRALRLSHPSVVIPTFSEIANAAAACGSPATGVVLRDAADFILDPNAIVQALDRGADAIFIGRPNSPTGTLIGDSAAQAIAHQCAQRGAWCIFDEAFIDFTGETSLAQFAAEHSRVIVIRSMTKIFAIPGLRLGFAVAAPETILRMRDALEPWSVSVPAERTGLACLNASSNYLTETLRTVAAERNSLERHLGAHPRLRVFPGTANFIMLAAANEREPGELRAFLASHGIAIRDLGRLPGSRAGLYRIGIRLRADNERLVEAARHWQR